MFMHLREKKVYKERINRDEVSALTYRKLFRFNKENVQWIARTFLPENLETRGGCISPLQCMEATLHYLADPGYQTSVAEIMGITQPSASKCVANTVNHIAAECKNWIKFPVSPQDAVRAKQRWAETRGFPYTLGEIDCTHVRIDKPGGQFGDDFINRKNFASFNVQATCDEKCTFTSVDVGWPGSVHDSRIFQTSELFDVISRNVQGILLGDSGYGITPYMMTPYSEPMTAEERHFNKIHARNRVIIEQSYGQLKRRFPILRYGVRLKLERIPKCILACFILHNVAKFLNDPDADFQEDGEGGDEVPVQGFAVEAPARDVRAQGQRRREEISTFLYERRDQ